MSTENKVFTDNARPEDSVSLSDLKNDGNEVHYAYPQERDEETVASAITGRSVTKSVAKKEPDQQEEVEKTVKYTTGYSNIIEDDEYTNEEEFEIESDHTNEEEKPVLTTSATPTSNDELKEMADVKVDADPEKIIGFDNAPKKEEYNIPTNLDDIEFPDDDEDEDENTATTTQETRDDEIINEKLKASVKSKIKVVAKKYDLSAFTVSKKPVALNAVLDTVENPNRKAADWVAYNTGNRFRMLGFTGAEIDKLNNPGGSRMNSESVRYKMLYDHIIDRDKPASMEEWAKCTSFFDIEHYWFGAFRATFEGEAYMPITNCPTDNKHVFLTDNLDIMDFVKFENDEAKVKFYDIYNGNIAKPKGLYKSDIVPVSEDFAIGFREPSIFNMVFEIAMLDTAFVEKYRDIIALVSYIDSIYYINKNTMTLDPIEYRHYTNNTAKTAKSKIIQFGKTIRKLSSDQYHAILMYIQEISKRDESISYQIPETTCIECNAVIPATAISADELVFTRHRLAALAAL